MLKNLNSILFFAVILSVVACNTIKSNKNFAFASNPVIAHRGAWKQKQLPQNSIASLKEAIRLKCTGSELDIRMTLDDILIVTHDAQYNGLAIEESTYEALRTFKLSNGEVLPTLKDYILTGIKENKATGLVCEIKPSKIEGRNLFMAEQVLNLVRELEAEPYILSYISFSYEIIKHIETLDPNANTQYLDGSKKPERLKQDGISGLDYHLYKFKKHPEWIQDSKKLGLELNAWVANKPKDIDWLITNAFDYITTDEPELVFERLKLNTAQTKNHTQKAKE